MRLRRWEIVLTDGTRDLLRHRYLTHLGARLDLRWLEKHSPLRPIVAWPEDIQLRREIRRIQS
jgi:hypothetical protein